MTCRVEIGVSFWGKAGQYFCTGASRSSFPLSYNCIAATAVSGFEIEASLYSVLDVAGTKFSRSAMPKPEDQTNCPFSTTATETPRDVFRSHEFRDCRFDLGALLGRKLRVFGDCVARDEHDEDSH